MALIIGILLHVVVFFAAAWAGSKTADAACAFFYNRRKRKQAEARKAMQEACSKAMGDYYRSVEYMETKVEMRNFRIQGDRIIEDRPTPNEYYRDMSVDEICKELEGR